MSTSRAYRTFRIVYALIALNFVLPAISYIVAPEAAIGTLDRVNRLLGGGAYPFVESGSLWHMLGVGNVMTLGFMCALLFIDLRRFYPVLPALAFLKAFSATYATWIGLSHACPAFLAIGVLDGSTTVAMVVFAVRARRALDDAQRRRPSSRRSHALVRPRAPSRRGANRAEPRARARRGHRRAYADALADRARRASHGAPTRLPHRDGRHVRERIPCARPGARALLHFRPLRFPFLVAERAIAPFDLSGLASSPERVIRHLLARPSRRRPVRLRPRAPRALARAACDELRERSPRSSRTTRRAHAGCATSSVFEGYHEALLAAVDTTLRGEPLLTPSEAADPDLSLHAYLDWCASDAAIGARRRSLREVVRQVELAADVDEPDADPAELRVHDVHVVPVRLARPGPSANIAFWMSSICAFRLAGRVVLHEHRAIRAGRPGSRRPTA